MGSLRCRRAAGDGAQPGDRRPPAVSRGAALAPMHELAAAVDGVAAATNFSGVVRVDFGTDTVVERAYAWADRAHHVPNTVATQFGIASGVKGLTASVVVSLA